MNYRYRISQEDLQYLYRTAKQRIEAHKELAEEYKSKIDQCKSYKTEKEALTEALAQMERTGSDFQIYAGIEKDGKIFRVTDQWIITDDWQVKQAADYIGLALMYDGSRLLTIIDNKVEIDEVVAYY